MKDELITFVFVLVLIGFIALYKSITNTTNIYTNTIYPNKSYKLDGVKHPPIDITRKMYAISDSLARDFKNMYLTFRDIAEKYEIKHWASGGTLLGAVRHSGFLPWDDDMDFHLHMNDLDKLLEPSFQKELNKAGLKLSYSLLAGEAISAFRIMKNNKENLTPPFIDLLFEYPIPGTDKLTRCREITNINVLHGDRKCVETIKRETWNKTQVFPLKKMKFEDIWLWVPNKPEEILKIQYGNKVLKEIKLPDIYHSQIGWFLPAVDVKDDKHINSIKTVSYTTNLLSQYTSNFKQPVHWPS